MVMSWVGLWSFSAPWIVVCGHVLNGSVIMSWVCDHFVACGLWSFPGWVCGHLLGLWAFPGSWSVVMSWVGLWSSAGSVLISWIVGSGHASLGWACAHPLGLWSYPGSGSMVMSWVCGHFPDRGLWSNLGWVCGHLLALWSCRIVGCGHVLGVSVVISWVCLWSSAGPVVISCLLVCGHVPGVSVVVSWIVVCGHVLAGSVVISGVCGHFLPRGLWSSPGSVVISGSSCPLGLHVFWVFMSSGSSTSGSASSCLGWVCGHLLGLRSLSGSWSVVCPVGFCGHVRSVVIFWVCDHFLDRGLW